MISLICICIFGICSYDVNALTPSEIQAFSARLHTEKNTKVQGTVSVTPVYGSSPALLIRSNGVPDHNTGTFPGQGPNHLRIQSHSFTIPHYPTVASTPSCLPQGPIGIAINGVAIYNPYTQTCCDAGAEELDLFDECHGHPSPSGTYHYHVIPKCLANVKCGVPSDIVGVAFDGFPIYGPIDENGRLLTKNDLDECNGRFVNGTNHYRYHLTNEFPYIIGCYKGLVRSDSGLRRQGQQCPCTKPTYPCTEFENRPRPATSTKEVSSIISCDQQNVVTTSSYSVNTTAQPSTQTPEQSQAITVTNTTYLESQQVSVQPDGQAYVQPQQILPYYPSPRPKFRPRPRNRPPPRRPFYWFGR